MSERRHNAARRGRRGTEGAGRWRLRLWSLAMGSVLALTSGGVLAVATPSDTPVLRGLGEPVDVRTTVGSLLGVAQGPARERFLNPAGKYFGVATVQSPWSSAELDAVATAAGARPNMQQYFVKFPEPFRPEAVAQAYRRGTLPMITWEPWSGSEPTPDAKAPYSMASIADGAHDAYLTAFATAVREQGWPVAIRFAHEMNGFWYPWGVPEGGAADVDYARAWRHVHDVFAAAGATNAIWVWSPNTVRFLPGVDLATLYPGDAFVDWIGLTGYASKPEDVDAAALFGPTIAAIRTFTARSVIVTETGAAPGPHKAEFVTSLLQWSASTPDVLGFIWFERASHNATETDWRFGSDPQAVAAMQRGMTTYPRAR